MIPFMFGKNDSYIVFLPIPFWAYYAYITKFSPISMILLALGIFSLISIIYKLEMTDETKEKRIKNTTDLTNFVFRAPLAKLAVTISSIYLYFTVIYGFFLEKDATAYMLWVANSIGTLYLFLYFLLSKEYREKIIEIGVLAKRRLLKTR